MPRGGDLPEIPGQFDVRSTDGTGDTLKLTFAREALQPRDPPKKKKKPGKCRPRGGKKKKKGGKKNKNGGEKKKEQLCNRDGDEDVKCDYVSTCGDTGEWMAVRGFQKDGEKFRGYKDIVEQFCTEQNNQVVPAGQYLTVYLPVALTLGTDIQDEDNAHGMVEIEINNKLHYDDHTVQKDKCMDYLMRLTDGDPPEGSENCYGGSYEDGGNDDTKGGTFQLGSDQVSYHVIPMNIDVAGMNDEGVNIIPGERNTSPDKVFEHGFKSIFDDF